MENNTAKDGNTPKALEPIQRATVEEILELYRDHPQASAMLFNHHNNASDCHEQDAIFLQIMTLADYYRDHPLPLALLQDRVENDIYGGIRQAAVEAIGKYYHDDPQTYSWLCDRALNSEDAYVRQAAVEAIGKYYQDNPQTYTWLCDRVQNSEDGYVRFAAVYALGDYYQNEPQTLALLRDRLENDDDYQIQKEALRQIIEHYQDDPQTLPLLQSYVQRDKAGFVMIAASALAKHYTDDPQTLPLLLKAIQLNENNYHFIFVLEDFIKLLIDHYPNDPQTLLLLLKVIQTTQTHFVLTMAIRLLVQHYPNDRQTLCFLHNFAQKLINNEELNLEYTYDQVEALLKALVEYHSDEPQTLSLLLQIIQTNRKPRAQGIAVRLLAQHYHNNPQTLVVLHQLKQNQGWTSTLIELLVKYYPDDPQTLPFLLDVAQSQDEDDFDRRRALEPLVHHYRNAPPVLPLLQHLAQNEPNSRVRGDALILLARGYRDSSETLPFLRQCIYRYVQEQQDVNYSWILRQIGGCYAGDSQFFSWLKELIQNTQTPGRLRAASVKVLVDCFLSHSETIELLNNIATHEPDEEARLTAMRAIAKHAEQTKSDSPNGSETLPDISIEIPEISTDCDSDYTRLCELLKAHRWKQADTETYELILEKLGRKAGSVIRLEEVLTLSSEVLQTIDRLWTSTSCGHFGFSIQREIYLKCGGTLDGKYPGDEVWQAFCQRVGWIVAGFLGNYGDIKFHLSSPAGHLPLWANVGEYGDCRYEYIFSDRKPEIDYTKLRNLLASGQWEEADYETYLLMLQVVDLKPGEKISDEELRCFPCTELQTIDQLWIDASQGRFGFSIQKDIYLQSGGLLDGQCPSTEVGLEFERRVGWYADKVPMYKDVVTFSIEAPVGHLPTPGWFTYNIGPIRFIGSRLYYHIFPRLEACKTS